MPISGKAMIDRDVAAVGPAQFPQPLDERPCFENPEQLVRSPGSGGEIADTPYPVGWLRDTGPRRNHGGADEQNDLAPVHSLCLTARAAARSPRSRSSSVGR